MLEAEMGSHSLPSIIGVIDLVRGNGGIVDFKTTKQTPDPDRVAHQTEIQLTCYGMLYREATDQTEAGFELHHLVKLKAPKLVITSLPPITDKQKTRLFRQMESYVKGVQRQDFVPSPGLHCASCQYFNECRRWS
jgi:CRISPR/Cas system-associated exonuclease Cas4 (RecB family)